MLTKAQSIDEATSNVNSFMDQHQDNIFDWYEIGGRWNNLLRLSEPVMEAQKQEQKIKDYYGTKKEREKEIQYMWDKMVKAREDEKEKEYSPYSTMSGYYAGIYKNLIYQSFSSESNVYDIEEDLGELPEDLSKYWAVVVDMHH